MRAEILTIGDELCRGEIIDTNSSTLAARLWDLDITTRWMTSCCDEEVDIAEALTRAVARADVVVCSGGLGPTEDDLTVAVVARLVGAEIVIDEPSRHRLETVFAGRIPVTEIQLRQLRVPVGARIHGNPAGLAPCFEVPIGGVPVICLPGFPREIAAILDGGLVARLAELREGRGDVERVARRIYRVFGRGESQISQACRGLVDGVQGATIHYQVKFPEILVKLVVRDRDPAAAAGRLDALDAGLRERLGPYLYGVGEETLVARTVRRLLETGVTVSTAESCTGGLVGALLTERPGSSRTFVGGAIVYSNAEKVRQLGVRETTLAAHGAVSEETVLEMARGACERFGADLGVAISGVAGPDGGTPDKPVGTVWLAIARRTGPAPQRPLARSISGPAPQRPLARSISGGELALATRKLSWPGSRDQVRMLSAWWALAMIDAANTPTASGELPAAALELRREIERSELMIGERK